MNVKNNQSVQSLQSIQIIDENQISTQAKMNTVLGEHDNFVTQQMLTQYSQSSLSSNLNSQNVIPPYSQHQQPSSQSTVINQAPQNQIQNQNINKSQNKIVKSQMSQIVKGSNNN